jgi:hypothetical protein
MRIPALLVATLAALAALAALGGEPESVPDAAPTRAPYGTTAGVSEAHTPQNPQDAATPAVTTEPGQSETAGDGLAADRPGHYDPFEVAEELRLVEEALLILRIQSGLSALGWKLPLTGSYDDETLYAIESFLSANDASGVIVGDVPDRATLLEMIESPDAVGYVPPAPAPTPRSPAAVTAVDLILHFEQIADTTGFDWRGHGVTFHIGCSPLLGWCSWGAYEVSTRDIYIHPTLAYGTALLEFVVLHELAHAWQFTVRGGWDIAKNDLIDFGHSELDGLEKAADCLAAHWGASFFPYGPCPAEARAHMAALYEGS